MFEFFHALKPLEQIPTDPVRLIWRSQGRTLLVAPTGKAFVVTHNDMSVVTGWFDVAGFEALLASDEGPRSLLTSTGLPPSWSEVNWTAVRNSSLVTIQIEVDDGRSVEVGPKGIVALATTQMATASIRVPVHSSGRMIINTSRKRERGDPCGGRPRLPGE